MRLLSHLLLLCLLLINQHLKANDITPNTDWRAIDIVDVESFNKVKVHIEEYYKWEDTLQLEYLEKLADGGLKLNIDSISYLCYLELGIHYTFSDSLALALKCLTLAESHTYTPYSEHEVYNRLGTLYANFEDYNTALDYYFRSMEKGMEIGNGDECYPIGNIGSLYQMLEDYQNAIKFIKLSIEKTNKYFKKPDLQYNRLFDYAYWIANSIKLNSLDSLPTFMAIIHNNIQELEGVEGERFSTARYVGYYGLSNASCALGNISQAYYYLEEANKQSNGYYDQAIALLRAKIRIKEKKYTSALEILNGIEQENLFEMSHELIQFKKECYVALNDYQKVQEINESYIDTLKSNSRRGQAKYMTLANTKFDLYEKNNEITRLENEQAIKNLTIRNQWNLLLLSIFLFLLLFGMLFLLWDRNKRKKELNDQLQILVNQKTANLQKANAELKMFNYIASHDLKEPLTTILSFNSLVQREVEPKSERLEKYFDVINTSIQQSRHLLEDIMRFWESYEESNITLDTVDLNELLANTLKSIRQYIQENNAHIQISTLPHIKSNASILFSVFKNIIENGIQFNTSQNPQIQIDSNFTNDNYVIISIKDNGIGIAKEYQEEILHSFKRLNRKSEYTGTGLGLSITQNLISKLDGKISLESTPQKGSTFFVHLPIDTNPKHL